jgi:hypothetical protein
MPIAISAAVLLAISVGSTQASGGAAPSAQSDSARPPAVTQAQLDAAAEVARRQRAALAAERDTTAARDERRVARSLYHGLTDADAVALLHRAAPDAVATPDEVARAAECPQLSGFLLGDEPTDWSTGRFQYAYRSGRCERQARGD